MTLFFSTFNSRASELASKVSVTPTVTTPVVKDIAV